MATPPSTVSNPYAASVGTANTPSTANTPGTVTPSNQHASQHRLSRIVQIVSGIGDKVGAREEQLAAFRLRCEAMTNILGTWSQIWDTPEMQKAGEFVQKTLKGVLEECENWQQRWFLHKVAREDRIQLDLMSWDRKVQDSMSLYMMQVFYRLHRSSMRGNVYIFNSANVRMTFQDASQLSDPEVQAQLHQLVDSGLQVLRSRELSQGEEAVIYQALRSMFSVDNVPPSVQLQGGELIREEHAIVKNSGSDIYRGRWQGHVVAVKCMRESNENPRRASRFLYEGTIWRMLIHPNILPFHGLQISNTPNNESIALVSEWADNRDAITYLRANPECDRRRIVKDTAYGIEYLHRHGIVHGAIRGSNIVIDRELKAMLTDFGLAAVELSDQELLTDGLSTSETSTTIRWLAPELTGATRIPVYASDVFSFGRTILEIMTGEKPFKEKKNVWELASLLNQGLLIPRRPEDPRVTARGLTDGVWALLLDNMWKVEPGERPTMVKVVERLENVMRPDDVDVEMSSA